MSSHSGLRRPGGPGARVKKRTVMDRPTTLSRSRKVSPHGSPASPLVRRSSTLLLTKGADVHLKTRHGETPLHLAVEAGHDEVVKRLLAVGADVEAKNEGDDTPLHYAAWDAPGTLVQILLDQAPDLNVKDTDGETPLHRAIDGGNDAAVQLLLAVGADVQAKTELGDSPLHLATKGGFCEAVQMLLDAGADMRAKNCSGETPEDLASAPGQERVLAVIAQVVETRRARRGAAAMGQHHRLGAGSPLIRGLDPEVLRMILEQI